MPVSFSDKRLIALLASMALVVAVVAALAWFAGPASDVGALPADETAEHWALPPTPGMDPAAQPHARLRARLPWGPEAAPEVVDTEQAAVVVEQWRFIGSVRNGKQRFAVLVSDAGKTLRLGLGEGLPNGERIHRIEADQLELEDETGARRRLRLYARD